MPIALALAAALHLAGAPDAAPSRQRLMERIEQLVVLPGDAGPIGDYARVYTMLGADNYGWAYRAPPLLERPKVLAVYSALHAPRGRRWGASADLPAVSDGGCAVIAIVYDIETDRIESAQCNSRG